MSKASDAANAMVYTTEQVCALYGVQFTREQSRAINMQGAADRWRPMFFGSWTDEFGNIHRAGKADILARPRIPLLNLFPVDLRLLVQTIGVTLPKLYTTRPLWIECKTGKGRLTPDQIAFKHWVESNGDFYLLLHDDVQPLVDWFVNMGVEKSPTIAQIDPLGPKISSSELALLPCKHCGELKTNHIGPAFGCKGKSGKVWSPKL